MKTEDLLSRSCVKCEHFAWWDGDFCCVKKMKILQEAPDHNFNRDIILALKLNINCDAYSESENETMYMKDFREFLNKIK